MIWIKGFKSNLGLMIMIKLKSNMLLYVLISGASIHIEELIIMGDYFKSRGELIMHLHS